MRMVINIDVPELSKAIDFYCSAFGLQHNRTLDDDVAELTGGSSVVYLLQQEEGTPVKKSSPEKRRYTGHWSPVHVDFVVDNIDRQVDQVMRAGATRESECVRWRGSKCVTFSDPFGSGFCLIEFENETYR